jgi:separase
METEKTKLMKLTVAVIKSKLASCGVMENKIKKMIKSDLIHLLLTEMDIVSRSESEEKASSINSAATNVVNNAQTFTCDTDRDQARPEEPSLVLILDEHMQRFPLESMEMFSNIAITRVPSLPFVHAILVENEIIHSSATPPLVDPTKVKYVIDPESNLSETASTLSTALDSMALKNRWKWEGVVGMLPPVEFMSEALKEENGLYLFCGHGGGENAFSRSQLEALLKGRDDGIRGCRSSVILMGCSSGKLQSVNAPKVNPSAYDYTMHYEPEGIALSYLYAGAPCVVGNLWDVTDRDIDRYVVLLHCQKLNSL